MTTMPISPELKKRLLEQADAIRRDPTERPEPVVRRIAADGSLQPIPEDPDAGKPWGVPDGVYAMPGWEIRWGFHHFAHMETEDFPLDVFAYKETDKTITIHDSEIGNERYKKSEFPYCMFKTYNEARAAALKSMPRSLQSAFRKRYPKKPA